MAHLLTNRVKVRANLITSLSLRTQLFYSCTSLYVTMQSFYSSARLLYVQYFNFRLEALGTMLLTMFIFLLENIRG